MKIRNQEILNFLSTQFGGKRLPVRVGYAISVNAEEAAKKAKLYEEQRIKLLNELAEKDENGEPIIENNNYRIADYAKLETGIAELRDTMTEMNVTTIALEDLAKCDGPDFDTLTVAELAILNFMIEK